jgi:hypothetical protein
LNEFTRIRQHDSALGLSEIVFVLILIKTIDAFKSLA